jgi:DHA3 family macrolide efflux protein-like MFS transporter
MRIFVPLRHRTLAQLWVAQMLSSIGDEVNRVAAVWLAAGLWGNDSGYLMSVHAACAFLFSIAAGRFVDRWDRRTTMVVADVVRAAAVAIVPVGAWLGWPLEVLLPVSVGVCGGFSMFFDPALKAVIPGLTPAPELRNATNALMESTSRFARCFGPALIVAVSALIPMMQFFTLDALTYVLSALLIGTLGTRLKTARTEELGAPSRLSFWELVRKEPAAAYGLYSGIIVNSAWTLILPLGMGLVVHAKAPEDVTLLGTLLATYGLGNLVANLAVGNAEGRPERLLFLGRAAAGVGFLGFSLADSQGAMMASAAFAAMGGPVTDVGLLGLLQSRYAPADLGRVYRGYLTMTYAGIFAVFFVSPTLFNYFGVERMIFLCAVLILSAGVFGFFRFGREAKKSLAAV